MSIRPVRSSTVADPVRRLLRLWQHPGGAAVKARAFRMGAKKPRRLEHHHHGIACTITRRPLCRAIERVLAQIRRCAPVDHQRLRALVHRFVLFPRAEIRTGTVGHTRRLGGRQGASPFDQPAVIGISPDASDALGLVATVAHELGHAVTRERDFDLRDGVDAGWASELCADHYAYKWGFGREVSRIRKHRPLHHHGPAPRTGCTIGPASDHPHFPGRPVVFRYRVTRSFVIHFVQVETPEGEVLETAEQVRARKIQRLANTEERR